MTSQGVSPQPRPNYSNYADYEQLVRPLHGCREIETGFAKENIMKRITLLGFAAALLTTSAFSQSTPAAPPSGGVAPSQPQSPATPVAPAPTTPGDREFLPPGQRDRDTLPPGRPFTDDQPPGRPFQGGTSPGRPFGSSTNAGIGRTNNVGGLGSGSVTNAGGITNRVTPTPVQPIP